MDKKTATYHHFPKIEDGSALYVWEQESISFDELIVSWDAMRPQYGQLVISIAVKLGEMWSPPFQYALWGSEGQKGGNVNDPSFPLRIKEDLLELLDGHRAAGFRIYLEAREGAHLDEFYSIHACASVRSDIFLKTEIAADYSIDLHVPLISQMKLKHPRHEDMCSSASTSAVVSYLLNINRIDSVFFALQSYDETFDIYGNWVLNTANASAILGKKWRCWVQRLTGFDDIYDRLRANTPVVVSVRGPLPGSALPYNQGHLLVVKGFQPKEKRVLCMDPAFPDDEKTNVSYDLKDFLEAWSRRQNIAYLFSDSQSKKSL
jgi:hypothetical protein